MVLPTLMLQKTSFTSKLKDNLKTKKKKFEVLLKKPPKASEATNHILKEEEVENVHL